jgi:ankyrin repeat protein
MYTHTHAGDTALRLAAHKGQLAVAGLLVQAQADPLAANSGGVSALDSASAAADGALCALLQKVSQTQYCHARTAKPDIARPARAISDRLLGGTVLLCPFGCGPLRTGAIADP